MPSPEPSTPRNGFSLGEGMPTFDPGGLIGIGNVTNGILDILTDECEAPFVIYWKSLLPAAGRAAFTLMGSDMGEVVRGFARPNQVRRRMKRGAKAGGVLAAIDFPDWGNEVGKRLPGARQLATRKVSTGVENLWMIDGVLQRGLYYWLLADTAGQFASDWMSFIRESQECQSGTDAHVLRIDTDNTYAALLGWQIINLTQCVKERGFAYCGQLGSIEYDTAPCKLIYAGFHDNTHSGCAMDIAIMTSDDATPQDAWFETEITNNPLTGESIATRTVHKPGIAFPMRRVTNCQQAPWSVYSINEMFALFKLDPPGPIEQEPT